MSLKDHIAALRGKDHAEAMIEAEVETTDEEEDDMENDAEKGKETPEAEEGKQSASAPEMPVAKAAADPADVAAYCAENGCAKMAAGLIREKATMEEVKARVGAADTIRKMVADAGKVNESITAAMAEEMISAGLSVDQARAKLFAKLTASQSKEACGAIASDTASAETAGHGWDAAIAKVNRQKAA